MQYRIFFAPSWPWATKEAHGERAAPASRLRVSSGAAQGSTCGVLHQVADAQVFCKEIEIPDDDAKQVVEIVRHATGEIACLHFLCLPQRSLDLPLPRYILGHTEY